MGAADEVNAYEPLMRRLRECERVRHHLPNLVAVNCYRRGGLLRAVDALHGIRRRWRRQKARRWTEALRIAPEGSAPRGDPGARRTG